MKVYIVLYETMYNDNIYLSLYKKTYNDNIYYHYMRLCIEKYLLSLHKKTYNDNKYFLTHESIFLLYEMVYNNIKHFSYIRKYIFYI